MMRDSRIMFAHVAVVVLTAAVAGRPAAAAEAEPAVNSATAKNMAAAAIAWLDLLSPELRQSATFEFDGPEREDWHFIPKERVGVSLREMDLDERRAAHALIRTALSNQGYLKATAIMALEQILREIEHERPDVNEIRHPAKYWFSVFGNPRADEPWGWRVEGHHLSLNLAVVPNEGVAAAPSFYGANPAEVRTGNAAGLRVLGAEEDLARKLMAAMSPRLRAQAVINAQAPRDVITGPGQSLDLGVPAGVAASDMKPRQVRVLRSLVREVARNLCRELANRQLQEIEEAGWENLWFAWAGGLEKGVGHYFRVHGPTFILEYDNTQNDANHVHLVWHSTANDFGADLLRRHYQQSPHHRDEAAITK